MQIYDQLGCDTEFTSAMDKAGREFLVLVIKRSWDFPSDVGGTPEPSKEPWPLVFADEATGEPGFSATLWETDFAHRKPNCDIILNGSAHAPRGVPTEKVRVGLKVRDWSKMLDVYGERYWTSIGVGFVASRTTQFVRQPISYDVAFGGLDQLDPDAQQGAYRNNPVGTGWAMRKNAARIPGVRLPQCVAIGEEITSPFGNYTPASFGPMGRGWPGRIEYGGTYDQAWIDNVFPFLPADFDDRYYQMAPPDQQIDKITTGDEVIIGNLTERGKENFRLPETQMPLKIFKGRDAVFDGAVAPDTLLFDCDTRRFAYVWRVSIPIRRIITEFTEAWVGPPTPAMQRARDEGRTYIRAVATDASEADL